MSGAFETILFALVEALAWAGLALLALLPFLLLLRARGERRRSVPRWAWALPAVAALAVLAWGRAGYARFERDCAAARPAAWPDVAVARPVGVAIDADRGAPWSEFHWDALVQSGVAGFVDVAGVRWCAGPAARPDVRELPVLRDCSAFDGRQPEFVVHVRAPEPVAKRWHWPEYRVIVEVEERATGQARVRATELVFGGGPVGVVLRAIRGGDQDFARLGCGYASAGIGPWRPTLSSRPQFAAYRRADRALVAAAVAP